MIAEAKILPLEEKQRLSRSLLWRLQRNYFEQQGIDAWRSGAVPHHITSSPFIADAYARVVMGFLRDWSMLDCSQPIHIVELGSGSGRFAYSFLKKFLTLQRNSVLNAIPIRYVMTDFTESNIEHWRKHPSLIPLIKDGLLDLARFDLESDVQLELLHSGDVLSTGTVRNPLVVISNYVFDSTPQDAFVAAGEKLFELLLTLTTSQNEIDPADPEILSRIEISADENPINGNYYEDPKWNRILLDYKQRLSNTSFLFPTSTLHCIKNLHRLSDGRMLVLSGDRGYSRDEDLNLGRGTPTLAIHGSFSMMVDYQIIGEYCRSLGANVLHPARASAHLNISAFMFGNVPYDFVETRQAYAETIEKFGPDDFFILKESFKQIYDALTLDQILAFLRLSCWDHRRFRESLPALKEHLPEMSELQKRQLHEGILKVWDSYLPIGEESDLAFDLGTFLLEMEFYAEAFEFLQRSVELYGMAPGAAYNIAVCFYGLNQMDEALDYVDQALGLDPHFAEAKTLRADVESSLATTRGKRRRRA
jgi:putative S-adenosyl-L-methionine-dependent methyltransferase